MNQRTSKLLRKWAKFMRTSHRSEKRDWNKLNCNQRRDMRLNIFDNLIPDMHRAQKEKVS